MATTMDVTNRQVKGQAYSIDTARATGTTGAIAETYTCHGNLTRLIGMRLHLNTAGTTSEDLTVAVDSAVDAKHDTVLYRVDTSAGALVDLPVEFSDWLEAGEEIDIAWPNTENRTYGLELIFEVY